MPVPGPSRLIPSACSPPERRAALLAIDEVSQKDPAKRGEILRILSEPTGAAKSTYVEPEMPEEIMPGSVEAMLWNQNNETQRQVRLIAEGTKANQEAFVKQQTATAARTAGENVEARYEGKLSGEDILAVATIAGSTGIAARFANGARI